MIEGCFRHCPGIGPRTVADITAAGYRSWGDCFSQPGGLPLGAKRRDAFLAHLRESQRAVLENNIGYLVSNFPPSEQWRILESFFHLATFFDIETTGLSRNRCTVTVIGAYHQGRFMDFVSGINLDGFLEILDESKLLVSFNGSGFDIPHIESAFHIPGIPVPHVDLRWVAYHAGFPGPLRSLEERFNIERPPGVDSVDGMEAVDLWYRWQSGDRDALGLLRRYCRCDVAATVLAAAEVAGCVASGGLLPPADHLFAMAVDV